MVDQDVDLDARAARHGEGRPWPRPPGEAARRIGSRKTSILASNGAVSPIRLLVSSGLRRMASSSALEMLSSLIEARARASSRTPPS